MRCFCLVAVGVALKEALNPEFKLYQQQVVNNAAALSTALQNKGFTIVSGIPRFNYVKICCLKVVLCVLECVPVRR